LDGLLKAIQQALNPDERQRRGHAALVFARKNFQISENCARVAQLLERGIISPPMNPPAPFGESSSAAQGRKTTSID
jgi:hypothetical protein